MNGGDSGAVVVSAAYIAVFGLVLARVSGVLVGAPVLGARQVPAQSKIGLALVLSLIFTPLELPHVGALPQDTITYALLAGRELLVGLAVGFAVGLIFTGIQMGGQLVGVQMGFGLAGILNPSSGAEASIVDGFYSVLATVIFLSANGHHAVITALARTFDVAPVASASLPAVDMGQVLGLIQAVFSVALRIAMPAIAALLLADVCLGLIGRAAPQMQIIVVGAPVKIMVGLAMLAASTPATGALMDGVFRGLPHALGSLLGTGG